MRQNFFVAALALGACCSGTAAVCQQGTPAPIVQPGAPGQPSRALDAVSAAPAPKPPSEADIRFMQDMIMHHGQAVEMTQLSNTRAKDPAVKEIAAKIDLSQGDEIRWMKQWLTERGIAPETMGDMAGMQMPTEPDGTRATHPGHNTPTSTAQTNTMPMPTDHDGMDHGQMDHGQMDHDSMPGMHHEDAAKKTDPLDVAMMPGMLTPRQMTALRASQGAQFDRLFLTGMMQHHNGALLMVKDLFQHPGAGEDPQLFDFANDVDNTQLAEIDIMKRILRKVNP